MISKKVQDAFNEQIRLEMGSAQLYLAMAAYFHSEGLDGMAQWMKVQAREETGHAMRFFEHLVDREGRAIVPALEAPQAEWKSALDAFKAAYKHEQFITSSIDSLVKLAAGEKDNAAGIFLQWFVTEQVEEEASASKVVQILARMGDSGSGLVMADVQLGKRE